MARLALSTAPTIRWANFSVVVMVDHNPGDDDPAAHRLRPGLPMLNVRLTTRAQHHPIDVTGPFQPHLIIEHRQQRVVEEPVTVIDTRLTQCCDPVDHAAE